MSALVKDNKQLASADIDAKSELIKRMFCKGGSDDELALFIHACKRTGLDPFMKQIYAIKRGNQMTIQTGIDGLRLIAERTGRYSPGKAADFTYDDKNKLLSATAYIKKMTGDATWHEVSATAYYEEYCPNQGLWNKMPRVMLAKCAEAAALRKAFPAEMSGLYTPEEMEQADAPADSKAKEDYQDKLDALVYELKEKGEEDFIDEFEERYIASSDCSSIFEAKEKDYDKILSSLQRRIDNQEKKRGSASVA